MREQLSNQQLKYEISNIFDDLREQHDYSKKSNPKKSYNSSYESASAFIFQTICTVIKASCKCNLNRYIL